MKYENKFAAMKPPLENLCDSNYWLCALQLNVYRYILESEYAMQVGSMYLGVVHPSRSVPSIVKLPRLDAEVSLLLEHEIASGRAGESTPGQTAPFCV